MSFYDAIRVGASGASDYEVERSLRFNDNDSPWLERAVTQTSNRRTFTISAWVKRSKLGNFPAIFGQTDTSGSYMFYMVFDTSDQLYILDYDYPSNNYHFITNRKFRDVSAWYHIVLAVDTTQATNTNRSKLYVNGVQETSFGTANYPAQNLQTFVNHTTYPVRIGRLGWGHTHYMGGYMAEYNFIDGLQLTPSSFGETNEKTGQWVPKKYVGSYGTNGFYINFSDNSGTSATTLGKDLSGNGNNLTPNNFSVAAGAGNDSVTDTPTNNFATLNNIDLGGGKSLANGDLDFSTSGAGGARSTFGMSSGKYYAEVTLGSSTLTAGLSKDNSVLDNYLGNSAGEYSYGQNGNKINGDDGSQTGYGDTFTTGDTIGIAFDADGGNLYFYKNGALQASGTAAFTGLTDGPYFFAVGNNVTTSTSPFNFGQRPFANTIPTGYKALNSANLPDPTILLPNQHFNTILYTGNGSTQTISGLNFSPDWVWIKERSSTSSHQISDTVRGATKYLQTNNTNAEGTSNLLTAFTSDGFSLGQTNGGNENSQTYAAWNWNAGGSASKTYRVVVVSDSGNKYRFRNSANSATFAQSAVTLDLEEGGTYTFDGSDSTMASHPIKLSTTANGTHGGGSSYNTGVTYELDGSTVTESAYESGYSSASSRKLIITVAASAPTLYYYCHVHPGMGGQINTNSTFGSSNFDGSTQSTVKANTTAGFSIVLYTGQQNASDTIGHGLGIKPQVVISKSRNSTYTYTRWYVHHHKLATNYGLFLDDTTASYNGLGDYFIDASFSSTVFAVGDDIYGPNVSNNNYVAYCFNEVEGYSKFGSYTPNQNDNGPFVYTGFRPGWILLKSVGNIFGGGSPFSGNWYILDTKRSTFNVAAATLAPPNSNAEDTGWGSDGIMDILSNGFKIRTDQLAINATLSGSYVYLAFAESPFKNSRAR